MKILVVCGAGASSTFVAQRLRRAASAAGLDWETAAGTEDAIPTAFADLVLVGPHLSDRLETIHAAARVPVAVLPADVFADLDGSHTLTFAQAALSESSSAAPPSTTVNSAAKSPAKGTS